MTEHSPEPWKLTGTEVLSADGNVVFDTTIQIKRFEKLVLDEDDVRRILACINALEGVPTDELEQFGIDAVVAFRTGR